MIDDTSLEFDMFEDVRRRLVEVFVQEGHARLEAEKIALYIVQGVRDVPKLLTAATEGDTHIHAEILNIVRAVLDNASALERARRLLLGLEDEEHS
jgi:hypothetical protein